MATTFTDLKTRLNTWLRDSANRSFTDAEKTEILTEAINDPYVFNVVRDTSLSTATNTYSYTAPTGIEAIFELGVDIDSNGVFHAIPRDSYELINGTIYFSDTHLPTGKTIQIVGKSKLTSSSTDFPTKIQEYVLHLAMVSAFEMLKTKLVTRFLTNDMTVSDINNAIATHKQRAAELRQAITNQRLVTL